MDTQVLVPQMGFLTSQILLHTQGPRHFVDLTEDIEQRVRTSGLREGLAVVSSLHTTAALIINEHEPELLKDLDVFLSRLAPESHSYAHNEVPCGAGEQPNGHAHCQALLLNASVTVPIVNGKLTLGRWQRIFLVELDCARPRRVAISMLGS